ncbi:MAG: hypothetical protein MI919_37760 [Holophagales bacterium]|nr:hypothetical protein [Holophagales bacterium]
MAVYERTYKLFTGELTPTATRFLVLPRYAFKDLFRSRWLLIAFLANFFFPLGCMALIYASHSATFLEAFPGFELPDEFRMGPVFMAQFLTVQGITSFSLALFVGPGLVSRDLANNGLGLYLSRPFSRSEYVLGKLSVLAILLSATTWVPGLLLIGLEANFAGLGWLFESTRLVGAVFLGSWLWILFLGFLALSVSAWVKWRPIAAFSMLLLFLGGGFFGSVMVNGLFQTEVGHLLNPTIVFRQLWRALLGVPHGNDFPAFVLLLVLAVAVGLFLLLLHRKIRAYEVVS